MFLETVKTHQGARTITITLDNTTHHLYLSFAEYEAPAVLGGCSS